MPTNATRATKKRPELGETTGRHAADPLFDWVENVQPIVADATQEYGQLIFQQPEIVGRGSRKRLYCN